MHPPLPFYWLKDTSTMASTASSFFYPCYNTHDKFKSQWTPSSWIPRYNTSIAHFCSQTMASVEYMGTTPNDTSWLSGQQNDPIGWEPTISLTSVYGMKTNPASVARWERECFRTRLRSHNKYSSKSTFRGLRCSDTVPRLWYVG
jgi:hypothetical protein